MDRSPKTAAYECRCSRIWMQKARCCESAASDSAPRSVTVDTQPGGQFVGALSSPVDTLCRGSSLTAVVGENHTEKYRGCLK